MRKPLSVYYSQAGLIVLLFVLLTCGWLGGCRPDQEIIDPTPSEAIYFSQDTVLFDTVFTERRTITRRVYVKNPNSNAIVVESIELQGSAASPYRIWVRGVRGNSFSNEEILGGDSLLVLVEATLDANNQNQPFLVTDAVTAQLNEVRAEAKLVAWGRDANYLGDTILDCNSVWAAEKPYVLTGVVLVDSLCTLTIEPGTEIYASFNGLLALRGRMIAEGTPENPILFRNDRLEEGFEDAPGQWGGIYLLEGSTDNHVSWASVRNAQVGFRVGTPDEDTLADLTLNQVVIENMDNSGILAFSSDIVATNTLINNCRVYSVGNFIGGHYRYRHCTFASYNFDFFREDPGVVFSDNIVGDNDTVLLGAMDVELINSVITGSLDEELLIVATGEVDFRAAISNNLLKTSLPGLSEAGNILNEDPGFIDPAMYDYRPDTLSVLQDTGLDIGIGIDLDNQMRDAMPDLGAYERID